MKQSFTITARLTIVSSLHIALGSCLFEWAFGARPKGFYFPLGFTLTQLAVSLYCLFVLIPIFIRGDFVQRLLASALTVLPLIGLIAGLLSVIGVFTYA